MLREKSRRRLDGYAVSMSRTDAQIILRAISAIEAIEWYLGHEHEMHNGYVREKFEKVLGPERADHPA